MPTGPAELISRIHLMEKAKDAPEYAGPETLDDLLSERAAFDGVPVDEFVKREREAGRDPKQIQEEARIGLDPRTSMRNAEERYRMQQRGLDPKAAPEVPVYDYGQMTAFSLSEADQGVDPNSDLNLYGRDTEAFNQIKRHVADQIRRGAPLTRVKRALEDGRTEDGFQILYDQHLAANSADPKQPTAEETYRATAYARDMLAMGRTQGLWTGPVALPLHLLAPESPTKGWQSPDGTTYLRMGGQTWRLGAEGAEAVPEKAVPADAEWKGAYAKVNGQHYPIDYKTSQISRSTDIVLADKNPDGSPGPFSFLAPKVSIVGVGPGPTGQPTVLTRQQGLGSWLIDMDALPEYAGIGVWDALSRGEVFGDEGVVPTVKRSIRERRDLFTEGMRAGEEVEEALPDLVPGEGGKAAGAGVGLLASFGAPNVLGVLGDVGRGIGKLSRAREVKRTAKLAEHLDEIADAIEAGDYKKAAGLEASLRAANPDHDGLARELERVYAGESRASKVTDVNDDELEKVVDRYTEQGRLTEGRRSYQGTRYREEVATPDEAQGVAKQVSRDYQRNLDNAAAVAQELRDKGARVGAARSTEVVKRARAFARVLLGPAGTMDKKKYNELFDRVTQQIQRDLIDGVDLKSKYQGMVRARIKSKAARHKVYRENIGGTQAAFNSEVKGLQPKMNDYADRFEASAKESVDLMAQSARKLADHLRSEGMVSMTAQARTKATVPTTAAEWYSTRDPSKLDDLKALARGEVKSVDVGGQIVTRDNLASVQARLDELRQTLNAERSLPLRATRANAATVEELDLSNRVEAYLGSFGSGEDAGKMRTALGKTLRAVGGILMGSDVDRALRTLPAATRRKVVQGLRELSMVAGDLGILIRNNPDDLITYLRGGRINHASGRRMVTSGFNAEDAIRGYYSRLLRNMDPKRRERLRIISEARRLAPTDFEFSRFMESLPRALQKQMLSDAAEILHGSGGFDLATRLAKEIGLPKKLNPQDLNMVTHLLDLIDGQEGIDDFLKYIEKTYSSGEGAARSQKGAHLRAGMLLGIYGHRARVLSEWSDDWIVISEMDLKSARKVLIGSPDISPEDFARGQEVIRSWGLKTTEQRLDAAEALYKAQSYSYMPAAARDVLGEQVSRAMGTAQKITSASDPRNLTSFGLTALVKAHITRGLFIAKPSYYLMNLADTFAFTYTHYGLRTATMQLLGHAPQNFMAVPGVANVMGLRQGAAESLRQDLGRAGDVMSGMFSRGDIGMHPSVNQVFDAEGLVQVGDQVYKASDLRRTFVRAGVMTGFEIEGIGAGVRQAGLTAGAAKNKLLVEGGTDAMADLSEAWAERERVHLALLLMREHKLSPTAAAERANKVLLEFRRGESTIEKSPLFMLAQPFWTFVRANQRAFIDAFNSPQALVRAGHILKVFDRGPEALTEVLREIQAEDPYGMDFDYLPIEYRDTYETLIALKYLQKLTPEQEEDVERAIEMIMAASNVRNQDGMRYEMVDPPFTNPALMSSYMLQEPMLQALPSYLQDGAVEIALPRSPRVLQAEQYSAKGKTASGYEEANAGARVYAYISEPAVVAALEHTARLAAAGIAVSGMAYEQYKYGGAGGPSAQVAVQHIAEFLDPNSNPVGQITLDMLDPNDARPYQVHPGLYKMMGMFPGLQSAMTFKSQTLIDSNGVEVQYPAAYAEGAAAAMLRMTPILNDLNRLMMSADNRDMKRTGWGNVEIPISQEAKWVDESGNEVVVDRNMEINLAGTALEMVGIRTTSR